MEKKKALKGAIKKLASYAYVKGIGYLFIPFILRQFRSSVSKIRNINDALEFAFSFRSFGVSIKPSQVKYEMAKLLEIVTEIKPRNLLEIGTANGGTLFLFAIASDPSAKIISVDLPGGPFGGGYPRWKIPLYKRFAKEGRKIYLIRDDSHSKQTLEKVKGILNGEMLDFLFIDGDHSYEGVKKDFEMYSPLVRSGGIIAFHDICPHPPETKCEVNKFWNEIKQSYKYVEIVEDWKQNWAGIGVIYV